ncbi:MAG: tyrosine-type recombinase/integrase [Planctomycetota bacterium]
MKKSPEGSWVGNPYKRPGSPYWSFVYTDAAGVVRRRSAKTRDLRIAREQLAEALREVEKQKLGHVDRYAETRLMPLSKLVDAYKENLEAADAAPRYVRNVVWMLRQFLDFAKVATVPGIRVADAERFVAGVRAKRSAKTRDHHASALRSFGRWLKKTGRWDSDPFDGLPVRTAKDKNRVFKRTSFRFEEAERLVEAVWARHEAELPLRGTPTHDGYEDAVRDRQVLYWFALTTAFRANECASIRWEDLQLDDKKASVRLAGKFTKNGEDANVPLQAFVVEALKAMRSRRSATQMRNDKGPVQETDKVFRVPSKIAEIVRKDAAYAGLIPQRSPTSKRVDFHCLRKSCARILIELNVHPKVIQQTLRHADIRLTMDLYGELGEDDLFHELPGKFPVPRLFAESAQAAEGAATA